MLQRNIEHFLKKRIYQIFLKWNNCKIWVDKSIWTYVLRIIRNLLLNGFVSKFIKCYNCFTTLIQWKNNGAMISIKKTKKNQKDLKHFQKIVLWNKFYIIFHFISLCLFISIQNSGRKIPLTLINIYFSYILKI